MHARLSTPAPVPPHSDEAPTIVLRRAAVGALGVLALLLVSGLLVELAVDGTWIGRAEHDATLWVAERRVGALDALASVGSSLTDTFTVIGVLVGAVTMLAASRYGRHALLLVVAVTTEFLVFLATSVVIGRERPDVEPLGAVPSTASFPSGHVAVAIALYGGLTLVATSLTGQRRVGRVGAALTALIAVYVGLSRVYEGVHHPIDVLGGVMLGLAALTSAAWSSRLLPRPDVATTARTAGRAGARSAERGRTASGVPSP